MDQKNKTTHEILEALQSKFAGNLSRALAFSALCSSHEIRARAIHAIGVSMAKESHVLAHQKLLGKYIDEVFSDLICSLYFAYSGLDNPARMVLRRALELGCVTVCYWDDPKEFWNWNSMDGDIHFSNLEQTLLTAGYKKFLEEQGCKQHETIEEIVKSLRKQYSLLSNVVHPKPYNFESELNHRFSFVEADLRVTLDLIEKVEIGLINLLFCRFHQKRPEIVEQFPTIESLLK